MDRVSPQWEKPIPLALQCTRQAGDSGMTAVLERKVRVMYRKRALQKNNEDGSVMLRLAFDTST
jgi:hypothetical protein